MLYKDSYDQRRESSATAQTLRHSRIAGPRGGNQSGSNSTATPVFRRFFVDLGNDASPSPNSTAPGPSSSSRLISTSKFAPPASIASSLLAGPSASTSSLSQRLRRAILSNDLLLAQQIATQAIVLASTCPVTNEIPPHLGPAGRRAWVKHQAALSHEDCIKIIDGTGERSFDVRNCSSGSRSAPQAMSGSTSDGSMEGRLEGQSRTLPLAPLDAECDGSKTSLELAIQHGCSLEMIAWLLEMGHEGQAAETITRDQVGRTMPHLAAIYDRADVISMYCDYMKTTLRTSQPPEQQDVSPLELAATSKANEGKASPDNPLFPSHLHPHPPPRGATGIPWLDTDYDYDFRTSSAHDVVSHLLNSIELLQGKTALHDAALKGNLASLRTLLNLGSSVDQPDSDGNTALHYASSYGHLTSVQLLIEHGGASFALRNDGGFSAADYAFTVSDRAALEAFGRKWYTEMKEKKSRGPAGGPESDHGPLPKSPLLAVPSGGADAEDHRQDLSPGSQSDDERGRYHQHGGHVPSIASKTLAAAGGLRKGALPLMPTYHQAYTSPSTPTTFDDARRRQDTSPVPPTPPEKGIPVPLMEPPPRRGPPRRASSSTLRATGQSIKAALSLGPPSPRHGSFTTTAPDPISHTTISGSGSATGASPWNRSLLDTLPPLRTGSSNSITGLGGGIPQMTIHSNSEVESLVTPTTPQNQQQLQYQALPTSSSSSRFLSSTGSGPPTSSAGSSNSSHWRKRSQSNSSTGGGSSNGLAFFSKKSSNNTSGNATPALPGSLGRPSLEKGSSGEKEDGRRPSSDGGPMGEGGGLVGPAPPILPFPLPLAPAGGMLHPPPSKQRNNHQDGASETMYQHHPHQTTPPTVPLPPLPFDPSSGGSEQQPGGGGTVRRLKEKDQVALESFRRAGAF